MIKVPQKANDVLVEPVLLFMDSFNVLSPPQVQAFSPWLGGRIASTNCRSLEVQEVAGGNVWAKTEVLSNSPTKQQREETNALIFLLAGAVELTNKDKKLAEWNSLVDFTMIISLKVINND